MLPNIPTATDKIKEFQKFLNDLLCKENVSTSEIYSHISKFLYDLDIYLYYVEQEHHRLIQKEIKSRDEANKRSKDK